MNKHYIAGLEKCVWKYIADMVDEEDAMSINNNLKKCYHCVGFKNDTCYYPLNKYLNFELINKIKK